MNNYFPHDSNARNSDRLIPLRSRFGAEGYGIYFMLLERLRDEPDYTSVRDYNMLAFDLRADAGRVKSVIEDFGLFAFTEDGKCFYSESLLRRMKVKDEKSSKARVAAKARWNGKKPEKAPGDAENASAADSSCERIQKECTRIADAPQIDASKVKESKEKNNSLSLPAQEEKFLKRFDAFMQNVIDGAAPRWLESVKIKFHLADVPGALARFRQYVVEMALLDKIVEIKDFQRYFVWKAPEFLKSDYEKDRNIRTGGGQVDGRSSKGYVRPACGLHRGKRE